MSVTEKKFDKIIKASRVRPDDGMLSESERTDVLYFKVWNETETHWIGAQHGGGFCGEIDKKDTQVVKDIPRGLIPDLAFIEDGNKYSCLANPYDRWNGWAKPFFHKDVILQMLKDLEYKIPSEKEIEKLITKAKKENETEIQIPMFYKEDPNNEDEIFIYFDYVTELYSTDGWCWELESD